MKNKLLTTVLVVFIGIALSGCTVIFQRGRRSDVEKIEELSSRLEELNQAKQLLEERLSKEIQDKQVKLEMLGKGLVITVVGDLLFDSGRAQIRREAFPLLDKVSSVLKEVSEFNVGIEGHTDNQPIALSGWKSNWELSSARALSVLHYLINEKGISPNRLSANGYGEFRPVASNDTREGRQLNRRVEIVILPNVTKVKEDQKAPEESMGLKEPQENLK
ncbi:MAG: OmpA family protein [Candidatus Omnitrophica bacterium]|nr:OmpA family protein [Candidatus Omnitrophota bacterium]MDD5238550.1 OmpA family protein [Candidatus Omnitrophota bacterium]